MKVIGTTYYVDDSDLNLYALSTGPSVHVANCSPGIHVSLSMTLDRAEDLVRAVSAAIADARAYAAKASTAPVTESDAATVANNGSAA